MKRHNSVKVKTLFVPISDQDSQKLWEAVDYYIEARVKHEIEKLRKTPQPRLDAENGVSKELPH